MSGEGTREPRIGQHYLQALLQNFDKGINISRITEGCLIRDLLDARAQIAQLQGQLEAARRDALQEALTTCERVEGELEAHYKEFGYGVSNGNIEAGGAISCQVAIEKLMAETGAGEVPGD